MFVTLSIIFAVMLFLIWSLCRAAARADAARARMVTPAQYAEYHDTDVYAFVNYLECR